MNRLFLTLGLLFILIVPQAWGQQTTKYPNPYRQTTWNNVTDSMHTLGQTPQQKKKTLQRLHNARTKARIHSIYLANQAKRRAWQNSQND